MTEDPIYIVLQSKSMDRFLYDRDLRHERVKVTFGKLVKYALAIAQFQVQYCQYFRTSLILPTTPRIFSRVFRKI